MSKEQQDELRAKILRRRKAHSPQPNQFTYGTKFVADWVQTVRENEPPTLSEEQRVERMKMWQAYMATRCYVTVDEYEEAYKRGRVARTPHEALEQLRRNLEPCERPVRVSVIRYAPSVGQPSSLKLNASSLKKLRDRYRARQAVIDGIVAAANGNNNGRRKQKLVPRVEDEVEEETVNAVEESPRLSPLRQRQPSPTISELLSPNPRWVAIKSAAAVEDDERRHYRRPGWQEWDDEKDVEPDDDDDEAERLAMRNREGEWYDGLAQQANVKTSEYEYALSPTTVEQLGEEMLDTTSGEFDLLCVEDFLDDTDDDVPKEKTKQSTLDGYVTRKRKQEEAASEQVIVIEDSCDEMLRECDRLDADEREKNALLLKWLELADEERQLRVRMAEVKRAKWELSADVRDMAGEKYDYVPSEEQNSRPTGVVEPRTATASTSSTTSLPAAPATFGV
jgi:hypothetical protein